jgi:hypothetical protein
VTAIKPATTRRVVAVAAETYPVNANCAWPDSDGEAVDPHHCFPRSLTGGDSYFVSLTFGSYEEAVEVVGKGVGVTEVPEVGWVTDPIPHVVGLSREKHEAVEKRQAKIVLVKGKWIAYDKNADGEWVELGELSPQPGARGGKKRKRLTGAKRRKRKVVTIRVPNDAEEDGAGLLDEALNGMREILDQDETYPPYYCIMAALDYTLLNADATDFDTPE